MKRWFRGSIAVVAMSVIPCACGADPIQLPDPPRADEVATIAAEYESPTGSLNPDRLRSTAESVRARIDELNLRWLTRLVSLVLGRLERRLDSGGVPDDPNAARDGDRASIDAVVDLQYVCEGWGDPSGAPAPEQNGTLQLTALVIDTRLQPDIWGNAAGCRARVDSVEATPASDVLVDGELSVHLYGPLPESGLDGDFLLRFVGRAGIGDHIRELDLDLRLIDRQLEFRHPVEDGVIIIAVGLTRFTLRGSNLVVTCDATTLSCD